MIRLRGLVALIAVFTVASIASASSVTSINFLSSAGLTGVGSYNGSLSYDSSSKLLTVSLTNTSATGGGKITGFLFNTTTDNNATYQSAGGSDKFSDINNVSVYSYGKFEHGASIYGNFFTGSTNGGVAQNDSRSFIFDITGSGASSLTALDFITQNSKYAKSPVPFLVRFNGFYDYPSWDKVPAHIDDTPVVPLPAAGWAGLSMLALLGVARRFRRLNVA